MVDKTPVPTSFIQHVTIKLEIENFQYFVYFWKSLANTEPLVYVTTGSDLRRTPCSGVYLSILLFY